MAPPTRQPSEAGRLLMWEAWTTQTTCFDLFPSFLFPSPPFARIASLLETFVCRSVGVARTRKKERERRQSESG